MDIQKIVTEAIEKLTSNEALMAAFKKDPIGTIEKKLGIDLPNDQIEAIVKAIKAKIDIDDVVDIAGKVLGFLKK